jgi:hypothetical protein
MRKNKKKGGEREKRKKESELKALPISNSSDNSIYSKRSLKISAPYIMNPEFVHSFIIPTSRIYHPETCMQHKSKTHSSLMHEHCIFYHPSNIHHVIMPASMHVPIIWRA